MGPRSPLERAGEEFRQPRLLQFGSPSRRRSGWNDVLPALLPGQAGGDELGMERALTTDCRSGKSGEDRCGR